MSHDFFQQALIFLAAALICVPIAKRFGLGSVLGYLLAGMLIGPYVLGFVGGEGEDIMHASEFGVVMMLFLIGLELEPLNFWRMRRLIAGMGLAQLLLTSAVLWALLYFVFSFEAKAALVASLAFSMSSTAIIMQTLREKNLGDTQAGRSSFAVLLLQDVAVIPILALLPLLAVQSGAEPESGGGSIWQVLISLAAIATLVVAGRYLVNPFMRLIARLHTRELFTISALFIVVGVAYLMQVAGLSAALGAFLAGVLLAHRAGIVLEHLPYRGGADSARDLAAGNLDCAFGTANSFKPVIDSGRGRGIALTSGARRGTLAALPTIAESGFPGFDLTSWNGIFAPAGTPRETIARLEAAAHHAINDAQTRERLAASGNDPVAGTAEDFASLIRRDGEMVRRLVAEAGGRPP